MYRYSSPSSSSSDVQQRYFVTEVVQRETSITQQRRRRPEPSTSSWFPFRFQFFKPEKKPLSWLEKIESRIVEVPVLFHLYTVTGWIDNNNNIDTGAAQEDNNANDSHIITYEQPQLKEERPRELVYAGSKELHRRNTIGRLVEVILMNMDVPTNEVPPIKAKIFQMFDQLESPDADLSIPIFVSIKDVTVRLRPTVTHRHEAANADQSIMDRATWASMQTYKFKPIPASKSSIQGLESVGIDGLDLQAIMQNTSSSGSSMCVICMDDIDPPLEDMAALDKKLLLTRLPCSHFFHKHCIVHWLETSHFCPLCRYPMPTEEEGDPPKPSNLPVVEVFEPPSAPSSPLPIVEMGEQSKPLRRLHRPRLLVVSAGGILTAVLLCRLLKKG